jgi:phosphatidylinositol alpha-mannosyltransferase
MRVAVVCPYSVEVPGGVQGQAVGLVKGLRASGPVAWLVAPGMTGPPEARLLGRSFNVRVNGSVAPVALQPRTISRVRRAIRDADVVHVHEPLVAPTSPAAFLGEGPPAVGTFHADPSNLTRKLYRLAGPVLRRVFEHLVDEVIEIPNGIDTGAFSLDVIRRPGRVVFLGRDEPRKGLDVLLAAWPRVRATVSEAELVVLGAYRDGAHEGIRYLGTSVGLEKRIHLAEATVFCAPNLGGESFGISLVEAMAAGCAPVVSDLPAFRSVAGDAARYVPVGNPESLADQLIQALRDGNGSHKLGRAASEAVAIYDWHQVLPKYLDLYERLAR